MKFNKTTEYAFRILSYMALEESRSYSVDEIFGKLHIPYRYLRKLMTNLSKSNFLYSIQGKNGGYKISGKLEDIKLLHLIEVVDPDYLASNCFFGIENCSRESTCIMHDQWDGVRTHINTILANTSLSDIKQGNNQNFIINNTIHSLKT